MPSPFDNVSLFDVYTDCRQRFEVRQKTLHFLTRQLSHSSARRNKDLWRDTILNCHAFRETFA